MVILVDYSRDDAFSADGSQVGHVPDTLHLHIRRPLPPGLVRPVAVVMGHVLAEHQGRVAFADDQDPVRQLAAEGPIDALADRPGPPRRAGPAACRISRTVDAAVAYPGRASSPWIRLWPQAGFSRAIRTISASTEIPVDGRPGPRRLV